jgi:hypothetical protein
VQALAHFFVLLAETLFFLGLSGSAVVVVLSFAEDMGELFSSDDEPSAAHTPPTR